jgi:hypothetical protein
MGKTKNGSSEGEAETAMKELLIAGVRFAPA